MAASHLDERVVLGDAAARRQPVVGLPVIAIARIVFRVHDVEIGTRAHPQPESLHAPLDKITQSHAELAPLQPGSASDTPAG